MMPQIDPAQLGQQEATSGHVLELEMKGAGLIGIEFIDDHTLLCVQQDGTLEGWALDASASSDESLSTPLHGDFEGLPEPPHEDDLESAPEIDRSMPQESPLAGVSSLPRPRAEFTRMRAGERVVSGHGLNAQLLWRFELGMRLESCVCWHAFDSWEGVRVAMGTPTGQIVRAEIQPSEEPKTYTLNGHGGAVSVMAFNGDGTLLVSSSRKRDICVWRADSTSLIQTPWRVFKGSEGEVWSLKFSPSGRYLVSGGIDNSVYYWDVLAKRPLRAVSKDHEGWIADLAWSDDERVVASASWDNTVGLFRNGDMAPLYCFDFHDDYVVQVLFVPDSNYLISAGYDQKIAVWDWRNAQLVTRLDSHKDWVQSLIWIGNGMMASASSDKQVRLWSMETLRCQYVLTQREPSGSAPEVVGPHQPVVHSDGFGSHRVSHLGSVDSSARARAAVESAKHEPLGEVSVFVDDAPSSIPFALGSTQQGVSFVQRDDALESVPLEPPVEDVDLAFASEPDALSGPSEQSMPEVDALQAQLLGQGVPSEARDVKLPDAQPHGVLSTPSAPEDWAALESSLYEDSVASIAEDVSQDSPSALSQDTELLNSAEDLALLQEDAQVEAQVSEEPSIPIQRPRSVTLEALNAAADSLPSHGEAYSESSEYSESTIDEVASSSHGVDDEQGTEILGSSLGLKSLAMQSTPMDDEPFEDLQQEGPIESEVSDTSEVSEVSDTPEVSDVSESSAPEQEDTSEAQESQSEPEIDAPLSAPEDEDLDASEASEVVEAPAEEHPVSEASEETEEALESDASLAQDEAPESQSEPVEFDAPEGVSARPPEETMEEDSEEISMLDEMLAVHDAAQPSQASWSEAVYESGESEPSEDVDASEVDVVRVEADVESDSSAAFSSHKRPLSTPGEDAEALAASLSEPDPELPEWNRGELQEVLSEVSDPDVVRTQLSDVNPSSDTIAQMSGAYAEEVSFAERAQRDVSGSVVEASFSNVEHTGEPQQIPVSMPRSEASLPEDVQGIDLSEVSEDTPQARPVYFAASDPDNSGIDNLAEPNQIPMDESGLSDARTSGFVMLDEFSTPEQSSEGFDESSGHAASLVGEQVAADAQRSAEQAPEADELMGDDVSEARSEASDAYDESGDESGEPVSEGAPEDSESAQEDEQTSAPQDPSEAASLEEDEPVEQPLRVAPDASLADLSLGMFDGVISDVVAEPQEPGVERPEQPTVEFSRDAVKSALLRKMQGVMPREARESGSDHTFPGMAINEDQQGHVPESWATTDNEPDEEPAAAAPNPNQTMFGFQGLVRTGPVKAQLADEISDDESDPIFLLQDELKDPWSAPNSGTAQSIAEQSSVADFDRAETVANASPLNFMLNAPLSASSQSEERSPEIAEPPGSQLAKDTSELITADSSRAPLRMPRLQPNHQSQMGSAEARGGLEENTRPGEGPHVIQEQIGDTSAYSPQEVSKQTMGFGSPMASGLINHLKARKDDSKPLPTDVCETFELTLSEIWQMRLAERKPTMQIFKRRRTEGVYRNQDRLNSHHDHVKEVVYCEQAKFFAVAGSEPVVEIWSPRRGRLGCLPTSEAVEHISVTLDGRVVVAGCTSGAVHVWLMPASIGALGDASVGKVTLDSSAQVKSVCFDVHGRYLMVGCSDGNTTLWDLADGQEHARLLHHSGGVLATDFDSNGPITACEDNILRFWSMDAQVQGLIGGVGQLISLKADKRGLYGLSVNGLLHHYQGSDQHETYTFDQHPVGFALSGDGILVVAGHRGAVSIYPKGLGAQPQVIDLGQDLSAVAVAGPLIVVGTRDGGLELLKRQ